MTGFNNPSRMPPKAAPKRLTHFLCIPLVTLTSRPQLQKSLQAFRSDVKDDRTPENPNGIPEKAIRPLGTLHLTLGVMSLLTPERVNGALALLRSIDIPSLLSLPAVPPDLPAPKAAESSKPLIITLRGLKSMHPPAKTSILYSGPDDPDGHLYNFCSALRAAFSDFLVQDDRPLLLHATIMNTVYVPGVRARSGGAGSGHGKNKAKMTIDAREVLERYSDVAWMEEVRVEKLAICRMGAVRLKNAEGVETGEEEYFVVGEVDMPPTG
jgi:activating signal cointegrator complex subunit 1